MKSGIYLLLACRNNYFHANYNSSPTSTIGSILGSLSTTRMWFLCNQSFTSSSWQKPVFGVEQRCSCHLFSGVSSLSEWFSELVVASARNKKNIWAIVAWVDRRLLQGRIFPPRGFHSKKIHWNSHRYSSWCCHR